MKTCKVKAFSTKLKPVSSEKNSKDRLSWALEKTSLNSHSRILIDVFQDAFRIDSKWLCKCKDRQSYSFHEGEGRLHRAFFHKSHIRKVVLLVAVASPSWDTSQNIFLMAR